MKGTVKWYNARKGYGFITPADDNEDVFIHATALKNCGLKKLYTGSEVSFETEKDEKGNRAKSIKVIKEVKPKIEKKSKAKHIEKGKEKTEKKDTKKKEVKSEKKETKKKVIKKKKISKNKKK